MSLNAETQEYPSDREGQKLKYPYTTGRPRNTNTSHKLLTTALTPTTAFFFFFSLPLSLCPSFCLSANAASFYTPSFGFSISQFLFTTPPRVVSPALTRGELATEKSPNAYVATDKLCSARLRFATRRHARLSFSVGQCCLVAPPTPHARARREVMWSGSRPMIG